MLKICLLKQIHYGLFSFLLLATSYAYIVHNGKKEVSVGRQWSQPVTQSTTGRNGAETRGGGGGGQGGQREGGGRRGGGQLKALTNSVPSQGNKN